MMSRYVVTMDDGTTHDVAAYDEDGARYVAANTGALYGLSNRVRALRLVGPDVGACGCECCYGGFCGGCGHAGCGRRGR